MALQTTPQIILPHLNWSLARLKEVIEKEDTDYYRGAALQRFRLTYEVAIKAIQAFAVQEGKNISSDESCFRWTEEKQWLEKQSNWIKIIENYKTVKSFSEEISKKKAYQELQAHYELLNGIKESMNLALSRKP
jgi:hypothetical protein